MGQKIFSITVIALVELSECCCYDKGGKNLFMSEGESTTGEGFQKEHLYWVLNDEKEISV